MNSTLNKNRTAKRKVVLIIDDEPGIREYVRDVLEKAGYTVLEAVNGKEGLELLRGLHIDVLITDVVMPEKEGLETINSLRSKYRDLRIIAMSGAVNSGIYLKMAQQLGAALCLQKPFLRDQILEAVGKVLGS